MTTEAFYFYDIANVSSPIKHLASCFNMAAENSTDADEAMVVSEGLDLYKTTTGEKAPTTLNKDEAAFLRWSFLESASKICVGKLVGWQTVTSAAPKKAEKMIAAAKREGISV